MGRRAGRMGEGRNEEMRAARKALFVGHGEDAIPAGRRLIEEIFLAAFPIGAGWAVVGPLVQNDLERFLRVFPPALPVEFMGLLEEIEAGGALVHGRLKPVFLSPPHTVLHHYLT